MCVPGDEFWWRNTSLMDQSTDSQLDFELHIDTDDDDDTVNMAQHNADADQDVELEKASQRMTPNRRAALRRP